MKTLNLFLLFAVFSANAHADPYHRFWRGMALSNLDLNDFIADLNQVFIPATLQTAAGKGLIAYEPVVTSGIKNLPDEIALVSYQDLQSYNALYSTTEGIAYQNLHWNYFDRSESHSLAPVPYQGAVAIEQAYDFHPSYADWEKNRSTLLVFYRLTGESEQAYLNRAKAHLDHASASDSDSEILDRVVLIADQYWVEYASSKSQPSLPADVVIPLADDTSSQDGIKLGSGVNLQF